MSLNDRVARAVVDLETHPQFKVVWGYFDDVKKFMEAEILSPQTDIAVREVMVRVHDVFTREVVHLPEMAWKQLNKNRAGQADAPA